MTKYILHGGEIRAAKDGGKAYFEEIVSSLGANPKLLLCFFAQPNEGWDKNFDDWTKLIKDWKPEASLEMAQLETFADQAARADALWIFGGDDDWLIKQFKKIPNYRSLLESLKVVSGESAGTILLAKFSWCCDRRLVEQGLGIVPENVLVHYGSVDYGAGDPRGPIDWKKAEADLRAAINPGENITCLPEGQFKVFQK